MTSGPSDAPAGDIERPLSVDEAAALFAATIGTGAPSCLLAVSGGPDSVAMMHLAARAAPSLGGARFLVATVDHGLRPQARAEAEAVAAQASALGLPHWILDWSEPKPATGIQEAARRARYLLLEECAAAQGASFVATAHTLDDQAETILMRLSRGSAIDGLAGMRATRPLGAVMLARPFLGTPKSRLVATCRLHGAEFAEDPSNRDERFGRVRIRNLLPLLAAEGLDARRLARLASRARDASDALDHCADRVFAEACLAGPDDGALRLDGDRLAEAPFEILLRVLGRAIAAIGADRELDGRGPRRERLEALARAIGDALPAGRAMPARTLSEAMIALEATGEVVLRRAAPRRDKRRLDRAE